MDNDNGNPVRQCGLCDFYKVKSEKLLLGCCGLVDAVVPGNMRIPKFGSNAMVPESPCLYGLRENDNPMSSRDVLAGILNTRLDLLLSGVNPGDVDLSKLKRY